MVCYVGQGINEIGSPKLTSSHLDLRKGYYQNTFLKHQRETWCDIGTVLTSSIAITRFHNKFSHIDKIF